MKNTLLFLASFFLPAIAFGCSCLHYTRFCEGVTSISNVSGVQVLQTYFTDQNGLTIQYVDVAVLDHLQGTTPSDTLTLLVSDGTSCSPLPNLLDYLPGDKLFVSTEETLNSWPNGFPTYHAKPGCKEVLIVANKGIGSVEYETFKSNFTDCALTTKTIPKEDLDRFLLLLPNPTALNTIFLKSNVPVSIQATVYAADGRYLLSLEMEKFQDVPIDVSNWPSGLYFVRLETQDAWIVKKFVKI